MNFPEAFSAALETFPSPLGRHRTWSFGFLGFAALGHQILIRFGMQKFSNLLEGVEALDQWEKTTAGERDR